MTTVEGGMIFTHNEEVAEEIRVRRNQGESAKYIHSHLGTNARMTDLHAAIGLAQFEKLPWMLNERQRVAKRYDSHFMNHERIQIVACHRADSSNAYFFYPVLVEERGAVVDWLKAKGIDTRIAYPMPVYDQELYRKGRASFRKTPCPVAVEFTSKVVNLPISPSLTDEQVDMIASEVLQVVG